TCRTGRTGFGTINNHTMALATLKYEGRDGGNCNFTADIGTNGFYKYAIAKTSTLKNGLALVDEVTFESQLLRPPEPNVFDSSFALTIPAELFKNNSPYVQLSSYKDATGKSPAFSEVVEVFAVPDLLAAP